MQIVKKLGLLLTLSLALFVGACNNEGGVETESPGEGMEEGVQEMEEGMEEGVQEMEEGIEGEN